MSGSVKAWGGDSPALLNFAMGALAQK